MERREAGKVVFLVSAIKTKRNRRVYDWQGLRYVHGAVGSHNFIAFAVPGVDFLLVIEFNDLAQLTDVLSTTIDFEASHTGCIRLGDNEFLI